MVLEATMIAIDNSEFTRNGDYPTTRFEAQLDVVDMLFQAKVNSNPENTVGLLAISGDGPQVLSTLTTDYGKILSGVHETKIHGRLHLATGLQVAALALKHRQNKVQHQRIIAFVGSPILDTERDLEKLAKKLKKNNVAVDIINYGEESDNSDILDTFISAVNSHDNSHLLTVPPGERLLYEAVASSPIVAGEDGAPEGGFGGEGGFDFGSDPNMDPDLALALRLSLEEEQARQAREQQQQQPQEPLESIQESTDQPQESQQPQEPQEPQQDGDSKMEDAK